MEIDVAVVRDAPSTATTSVEVFPELGLLHELIHDKRAREFLIFGEKTHRYIHMTGKQKRLVEIGVHHAATNLVHSDRHTNPT